MKHFYRILFLFMGLFATSSSFAQYCTPLYDTANCATGSQDYINSFSTSGGITNITNLASGCTSNGLTSNYNSYSGAGYTVTAQQGSTFNISLIVTPSWAEGVIVWADWNHDFVFDSLSERIYSSTTTVVAGGTATAAVTVPTNAFVGNTRIRARVVYGTTDFGACTKYTYGEAEDYQLTITSAAVAPTANFTASTTTINAGSSVTFTDLSSGGPTSWFWSFPSGTPSTSTLQNPTVVYSTPGTYSVTLTASNASGSNTITATNYITVVAGGYCITSLNPACGTGDYISNVSITGTTLSSTSTCTGAVSSYSSYPPSGSTTATLYKGSTYQLNVTSIITSIISCWIDYNQNQLFETNEWFQVTTASTANLPATIGFTVPSTALSGTTRMRIRTRATGSANASTDACSQFFSGETEDYTITIANVSAAPAANFIASSSTVNTNQAITFTDLSTNTPTSWFWSFPGGTPSTSTLQNPVVSYSTPGTYSVTLTATNASGSNSITATNYITVTAVTPCIPVNGACNATDYISNVTIFNTTFNSTSTCAGTTSSYSSFPASGTTTATVSQGNVYQFSVTSTTASIISIWIDFNHSGAYDANEWTQVTTSSTANVATFFNLTIPNAAALGLTSMRIRSRAVGNLNGSTDACTAFGSGETEDYQITVVPSASAPVANFSANFTTISVGGSTNFTDLSTNVPVAWTWSFPGGTPASSTVQNPTNIVYNTPGCYAVTLTASNSSGSNSVTSTCYINVLAAGQQYCLPNPTNGTTGGDFINGVTLNTLSNVATGSQGGASYTYYNTMTTDLYGGSTYTLYVGNGAWATDTIAAWIDYNGDGDFFDAGEKIDQLSTTVANATYSMNFTVPTSATGGYKIMRVRLIDNSAALPNADPCTDYLYGETEDYIVNIVQSAPPVAGFTSDVIATTVGSTVSYFDISTNSPTSWSWSFPGGSPSSSTLQNPTVVYNTPGCYAVTLTASNAFGNNSTTTTCYIQVTSGSTYCTTNLHSIACSGGYINTISLTGTTLNAANTGCANGNELGYVQWSPTGAGTATVTKGQTYTINVTTSVSSIISVWIDYNQNGTFETTEWKQVSTASTANAAASTTISIPTSALTGFTRMRVRSRNAGSINGSSDACTLFGSGETEDFIIQIQNSTTAAPVAAFTANFTIINVGQSVTFTDLSTNSPTSWAWTFNGGTPASSTTQNPTVTYNTAGTYSVTLTATNAVGFNTATQTNYITVLNAVQYVGMGSSSNVYTALVEQSNCLTANQDVNMIMFTRRKNTGDAGNSGYVQSSYSINGGAAFDSSLTIVSNATNLSRYPSGAIFNTSGNTTAANAFSVVSGPFTTAAGSWAGNYFGSSKINNTFNNQLFYTNTALPTGQIKSDFARYGIEANSAFVSVCGGRFLDVNGTTTAASGFSGAVWHKGVYSSATSQFTWTPKYIRHAFSHSTVDNSALAVSTPLTAFSSNGTVGYMVFMGVDSVGFLNGSNKRYQPIVYKTTNSGTTWSQMTLANYTILNNINPFLTTTSSGTKAAAFLVSQGWDVTVDANNNLHIATVIGSHSSEHVDSLTYVYSNSPKYVYDVYTTSTGWNAMILDTITTDEVVATSSAWQASDGTGGNGWGSRLQISKSSDGNRIFYGWVDTDPMYASTTNTNPDINVKGYNVQTNLLTPTRNFTKNTYFGGKAFFHYISNITLKSGTTYTIPGSLVSSRSNTYDAIAPVQHWYVKNMQFTDNDFTITPTQGSVATLPNASFTPSAIDICVAGTINFTNTSTNATSYSWSFPGGNPSTSTALNPTATWTVAGTYTVTLTATNANGSSTATQTITVNAVPTVSAGTDATICAGASAQIGSTSIANTTYSWTPSTGLSNATISNPTANPTATTTYTVTASRNGCTATDVVVVTVNPAPTVNAGSDAIICAGASAQLGSASSANTTYSWTPTTGLNNATISNPTANPTATTVYTVTATSNGCTATDVVVVTINASPTVNLGADVNVCNGGNTTLNAGNQGSTFSWTPTTGLSSSNTQTVVAAPSSTTTYIVTVTNSTGCSASDNITVNVSSVSANAGSDVTICSGSNTTLTATGGTTYTWSPSTGLSSTTGASVVASPTTTTTYTVTATNNGCTATDQVIVNVNSVSASAGADASICPGGSTQLLASGGTSYSWSPSTGLSSTSISNPIATPSSTTTYTVTVTNGTCTATDAVVVNVNGVTANAGNDQNICLGSSTQLTATGGTSYSWSPSTGLSSASIANPIATPSTTTTYTVTVSNNGCSNTDQITVTVNTSSANAGNDVTICAGNSVQLAATGGVSYSWSPATGLSNANAANPIASPTQTTTYLVTATSGACVTTDFVTVTVANSLNLNAGADQTLCSGQTVQMNATGGAQYSWSPATGLSNANIANPVANPSTTTTYTVTTFSGTCSSTDQVTITVVPGITANAGSDITLCNGASSSLNATGGTSYSWSPATGLTNPSIANPVAFPTTTTTYVVTATTAGCSDVDTIVVTVGNATANAGIDIALCAGQNTTLNATGGTNYSWSPSTGLSNATISNPIATPSATTTYTVTVTSGVCTATDNVTITVSSVSVNAGQDVQICAGSSTNLNALGSGATTYTWTPTTGISNPSVSNPIAAPTTSTLYTITVTDGLCSASDNINVVVNQNPAVPTITDNSGTLSTGTAVGYQWLLNGNIIPGANAQQYVPVQNGSYSVVITNGNGCTATSAVYSVLTVGIEDSKLTTENVALYPNPVSSELTLKVDFFRSEMAHIEIVDMLGKSVIEIENGMVAPGFIKTVDVSSLTSGVYFVRIKTDNQNIIKKLIRE